jgi:hypothetical protein
MPIQRALVGVFFIALALAGCGGALKGNGGPDGSTDSTCALLGACDCLAAGDRCVARSTECWCPSACYPGAPVDCFCSGGAFVACEDNSAAIACAGQLGRVQSLCAGQPFVGSIDNICATNPTCMAGCLGQLGTAASCSQIDCSFCLTCDCAPPTMASALRACVTNCSLLNGAESH